MKTGIVGLLVILLFGAFSARAEDRALVVGADVYADQRIDGTPGAVEDAGAMRQLLIDKFGFRAGSIKMLVNEQATAASIVQNFQTWLVGGTRPGDRVFFFYAGHGFQAPDDNGDEQDGQDEVITPYDIAIASSGGKVILPDERTFIRDDKFNDFIAQLSGRRAVLMFDSCHSGTLSRGLTDKSKHLPSRYLRLKPTRGMTDRSSGGGGYSYVPPRGAPRDLAIIKETGLENSVSGVVVFSAASPYQQAFPIELGNSARGAFSYLFENLIRQNPAEKIENLERNLKREMQRLADRGQIGKSENGEFQVPQLEVVSKINLADKPLFAASASEEGYLAAAESALFNPLSSMRVKLDVKGRRFKLDDPINFSVEVGENAYLYVLVFSAQEKAFCIFPSPIAKDPTNFVMKGEYNFPRGEYHPVATEPIGKDVWVALISKKKLNLGEKEEYPWAEMFDRIGLEELRKAIVGKTRGAGNVKKAALTADDWQADTVVVETVP